ncbi:MAG: amidotransferase 1, exosortase A system-associated [Sandaracinaceae bacterium]
MCGIAGAVGLIESGLPDAVARMTDAQAHRGPDQDGQWRSGERGRGAVLGHRRLSILDLSEAGRQPMIDPETGVVIAYNGEAYNFGELAAELRALGVELKSTSDTEVVLKAYARWGEKAIARLRGMFAIALWDPRDQTLLLARDRLGIKPLYYAEVDGALLFASEIRAMLASEKIARRLDPSALERFLWHGFVPGPGTLIEGVKLLPAGTCMRIPLEGGPSRPAPYWTLPKHRPVGEDEAVADLSERLNEAVKLRLIADVPLGIFLSGGVDSSAVAALAQRAADAPVTTFNISFEEARYDESKYARQVAEKLGTEHREIALTEQDFTGHLDEALESIDQPTFDAINTWFVSRAVKQAGLTVALAGTGGDELFGGYASFTDIPKARRVASALGPVPQRAKAALADAVVAAKTGRASEVSPQTRWGKLADVLGTRGDRLALYQTSYALFTREMNRQLALRPSGTLDWGLDVARAAELRELIDGEPDLHAVSLLELSSFLGERLLRDTDAASMDVSLEVRVPLLDHLVVESLARVPIARRFEPLRRKQLLREMMADDLDPAMFDRPKAGFELPLAVWCRRGLGPKLANTFRDLVLAHRIGLNGEAVGRVWRAFDKGGAGVYWSRVWALFVLLRWCEAHGVEA